MVGYLKMEGIQLRNQRWQIISAQVFINLIWASAFPGIRVSLEAFSPQHLVLLRLIIGSLLLLGVALLKGIKLPDAKDIPALIGLGGLGFTSYHLLLSIGEKTVSAGIASLLVSTTPILSALLAFILVRERIGKMKWLGSCISIIGISLISFTSGSVSASMIGISLILLAALSESMYFVFQVKLLKKYGFLSFVTYTIWGGALLMLFFSPGIGSDLQHAPKDSLLSVLYLGIIPTIIPYLILAYITAKMGASEATSSLYMTPVFTFVISWLWIYEVPTFLSIAGGIITLLGIACTHLPQKTRSIRDGEYTISKRNI